MHHSCCRRIAVGGNCLAGCIFLLYIKIILRIVSKSCFFCDLAPKFCSKLRFESFGLCVCLRTALVCFARFCNPAVAKRILNAAAVLAMAGFL